MVTVTMVIAPAQNRIVMQEPNFRIYLAISTLNRGVWYLDQRTHGNILIYYNIICDTKVRMTKYLESKNPIVSCYPKIYVG